MEILKENDLQKLVSFLKSENCTNLPDSAVIEFFKQAPKDWILTYLDFSYPCPGAERYLMSFADADVLQKSYRNWGFFNRNIISVFKKGSISTCQNVLNCLTLKPSVDVELAVIERNDTDLFKAWLEKFDTLEEDSERYLHERVSLRLLKNIYIEYQISSM